MGNRHSLPVGALIVSLMPFTGARLAGHTRGPCRNPEDAPDGGKPNVTASIAGTRPTRLFWGLSGARTGMARSGAGDCCPTAPAVYYGW